MNNIVPILAASISSDGSSLVRQAFAVLIVGICALIVWALGRWAITKFTAHPIVMTIWNGFFILIGAIVVLNFLLSLIGHGFIKY